MSTARQKKVAKAIVANAQLDKPLTGGEIVESSGYGVSMKKNPQVILNSDGVKHELMLAGFTEDNAKGVVAEIMLNDDADYNARLKATDQVFKVEGSYAPEKSVSVQIEAKPSEELAALAERVREEMRKEHANTRRTTS